MLCFSVFDIPPTTLTQKIFSNCALPVDVRFRFSSWFLVCLMPPNCKNIQAMSAPVLHELRQLTNDGMMWRGKVMNYCPDCFVPDSRRHVDGKNTAAGHNQRYSRHTSDKQPGRLLAQRVLCSCYLRPCFYSSDSVNRQRLVTKQCWFRR